MGSAWRRQGELIACNVIRNDYSFRFQYNRLCLLHRRHLFCTFRPVPWALVPQVFDAILHIKMLESPLIHATVHPFFFLTQSPVYQSTTPMVKADLEADGEDSIIHSFDNVDR